MQMEASDAFDIGKEPESIRAMYRDHVHGRQTLIAAGFLEHSIRFVQLWHGAGRPRGVRHDNIESAVRKHSV